MNEDNVVVNPLEQKVTELEKRIAHLEGIEKRRQIKAIIGIIIRLIIYATLIIACYFAWQYVNETVIKPYQETIGKIQDVEENTQDTINKYVDKFTK